MSTIQAVAAKLDPNTHLKALCRVADRATTWSGVSSTVIRVEEHVFVARGINGEPLKDPDVRQTLASKTDGGELWWGHVQGRGAAKVGATRTGGLVLGAGLALAAGATQTLAPGVIPFEAAAMAMFVGTAAAGFAALSSVLARRAEQALHRAIAGDVEQGTQTMPSGWKSGSVELRKRPRALVFAPQAAVPMPAIREPERVSA